MKTPSAAQGAECAPTSRHVVIGTAGHIDHGKTALVFALTGTDTDRLPEEKQRGITIDLGFAAMHLTTQRGETVHLSLIDVPGHHAFVRNMLAGAGGIDGVLLVIAADEGVKAQTEEHLAICSLLGIRHGIVALTKADAVKAERLNRARELVVEFLRGTFLEDAPIFVVSARTGEGLDELKRALADMATRVPQRSAESIARLPVDRAFSMRGFGTVVTGTLQAGTIRTGEILEQQPAGRVVRVRGLQVHGVSRPSAQAPCRVALNLSGVEAGQITRGDMLAPPGMLEAAGTIDVEVTRLAGALPPKHGGRVRVHAFAAESLARVLLFAKDPDLPGANLMRLRLAKPMALVPGDRFALRQCSPAATIGGGRVLDASPLAGLRKPAILEWLLALRQAGAAEQLRLRTARRGMEGMALAALMAETGLTEQTVRLRAGELAASGRLVECVSRVSGASRAEHWVTAEALSKAIASIERELHGPGPTTRAELRSRIGLNEPVFETAMARMIAAGTIEAAKDRVRLRGLGDQMSERTRRQLEAVESVFARAGLAAPQLNEVATELGIGQGQLRELVTLLLRSQRLVRLGADHVLVDRAALEKLYAGLGRHRGESFDVARFKAFTGLTRKHAIPLLEHLDRARVTRKQGDVRFVL